MRGLLHILMSMVLVVATTGLSISKHYCGNTLMRATLGTQVKSCMPDMQMGHGCCDEETETRVVNDDFQLTQFETNIIPEYDLLVEYLLTELVVLPEKSVFLTHFASSTGPPVGIEHLYIKVQSFLL